jgi:ketopantoate reductase
MPPRKSNILLIGSGGVGTIAALNLEASGLASVTAVLRSNFEKVQKDGFSIKSCNHGVLKGWKPSEGYHIHFSRFLQLVITVLRGQC